MSTTRRAPLLRRVPGPGGARGAPLRTGWPATAPSDGKLRVVIVTAMSFLGASAQAGTIAALNFFVKGIESEVPKVVPYLGFPIQSDVRTLLPAHRGHSGPPAGERDGHLLRGDHFARHRAGLPREIRGTDPRGLLTGSLPSPGARGRALGAARFRHQVPPDHGDGDRADGRHPAGGLLRGRLPGGPVHDQRRGQPLHASGLPPGASISLPPEHADAEGGQVVLRGREAAGQRATPGISSRRAIRPTSTLPSTGRPRSSNTATPSWCRTSWTPTTRSASRSGARS